jgi:hypothetical protein
MRSMRSSRLVSSLFFAVACLAAPASAAPPDAAKIRVASEEFDQGARAFKRKDYELAASHFEAADAAAPSEKAIRLAIRARSEAGQASRAATLAALALARQPTEPETAKLARKAIVKTEAALHKLNVSCISPCVLALGTRAIHGEPTTRWVVYADPGKVTLSASFFGDAGTTSRSLDAVAGGSSDLRFEPDEPAAAAAPVPAPKEEKAVSKSAEEKREEPKNKDESSSGLPPIVFYIGGAVTVGLAGVTVWSGLDAQNNPGVDRVRAECAGQTTDCPTYQEGVSAQGRTNVLIGATAGAAAVTLAVGLFFTDWGGGDASARKDARVTPWASLGDGAAAIGAAGRF